MSPGARSRRRERVGRVAFGISTLCFALAAMLSVLAPEGIDLGQSLLMFDPAILAWLQTHVPPGVWGAIIGPFLVRPVWLVPGMVGLIAGAVAWTAKSGTAR